MLDITENTRTVFDPETGTVIDIDITECPERQSIYRHRETRLPFEGIVPTMPQYQPTIEPEAEPIVVEPAAEEVTLGASKSLDDLTLEELELLSHEEVKLFLKHKGLKATHLLKPETALEKARTFFTIE